MNLMAHVTKFAALGEIPRGTISIRLNQPQTMQAKDLLKQVLAAQADGENVVPAITPETLFLALLANAAPEQAVSTSAITNLDEVVDSFFSRAKAEGGEEGSPKPARRAVKRKRH